MPNRLEILELALKCGFKPKQQPNGLMDLNPYVYEFADQLVKATASMDTKRLDWLADPDNKIGNVMLPQECKWAGLLNGLRGAIDKAMKLDNKKPSSI